MAFGRRMTIERRERPPIILAAIAESDLNDLPAITDPGSEPIRRYVTQAFIEEAKTLKGNLDYFKEWRDPTDSRWWGVFTEDKLIGFTGYRDITTDPQSGLRTADSRMVLMNPDYLGQGIDDPDQGIGTIAGMARTYYGLTRDRLDRIHARVDIRNDASYRVVHGLGYLCVNHTNPRIDPDPERHLVELRHPDMPLNMPPSPYHGIDSWEIARSRTARVLELGAHAIVFS